ncbi:hypothetical protein [Nonomuraea dietziae]|uniref:hypothetical protein n=1 Tax=Nonomuraea dietziae TaxID=65515 RepID=UPI0031E4360E
MGDLPHPLRSIVYDCLAKDPARRPTCRTCCCVSSAATGSHTTPVRGGGTVRVQAAPRVVPVAAGRRRGDVRGAGGRGRLAHHLAGRLRPPPSARRRSTTPSESPAASTAGRHVPKRGTPRPKRRPRPRRPAGPPARPAPRPRTRPPRALPRPASHTTTRPTRNASRARSDLDIQPIQLSGGPGQVEAEGCYMPPVHFQTTVASSRKGIWISYRWLVDGMTSASGRAGSRRTTTPRS